ncbi:MAG: thiamine-phosphate kinase [Candidatus Eisenbacteria sp.]|nr:thiamine-phosphate kinase [Candidatus Eisenbacteria bacterium]
MSEQEQDSIASLGEFRLIDRIREKTESLPDPEVGIGDDAAVLAFGGEEILLTTDAFVEGVHFDPGIGNWNQIGARMITAAVSDVAAMGGTPRHAVVSLCSPPDFSLDAFDALVDGLIASCKRYRTALVGGDTVHTTGALVVSVTVTGAVTGKPILRSGARVGDTLAVTGWLGGSHAGLLASRDESLLQQFPQLATRHLEPAARVQEGELLASSGRVTSMIDISDGLSSEAHHLAGSSNVGLAVHTNRIPFIDGLENFAKKVGETPLQMALASGEEYELLFTVSQGDPGEVDRFFRYLREKTGIEITPIGEVLPAGEGVVLVLGDGERKPLPATGYHHF